MCALPMNLFIGMILQANFCHLNLFERPGQKSWSILLQNMFGTSVSLQRRDASQDDHLLLFAGSM